MYFAGESTEMVSVSQFSDGLDFFPAEDVLAGKVKTFVNRDEGDYMGEFGEMSLVLSGPPFLASALKYAISSAIEQYGGRWMQIDILENPTLQVLGVPVWGNYVVKAYYHGSPALALPLVAWGIIAAVILVGVTVMVWQVMATIREGEQTKRADITQEIVKSLPADERAKAITELTKPGAPGGPTAKDPNKTDWGGLAKIGIVVFGIFVVGQTITGLKVKA